MNASDPAVHITFVDWIPGICSALGMLVINLIDKTRLSADSFSYSGNGVAWKAKLVLFLGFALLAGGLAGSAVVLVMKYTVPGYVWPTIWLGIGNVVANFLIMLRYIRTLKGVTSTWLTALQLRCSLDCTEHGGRVHLQPGALDVSFQRRPERTLPDPIRLFTSDVEDGCARSGTNNGRWNLIPVRLF